MKKPNFDIFILVISIIILIVDIIIFVSYKLLSKTEIELATKLIGTIVLIIAIINIITIIITIIKIKNK